MLQRLTALLIVLLVFIQPAFSAADDISRLYSFTSGTTIQSSQVNGEFNQLITTMNSKFGRGVDNTLTGNNTFSGANTFSGIATFSSATTPIKVDSISERTAATGVTIDSVLLKDGFIRVPAGAGYTPATNGDFGYDSTSHTYDVYVNGVAHYLIHDGNIMSVSPKFYVGGPAPQYISASTVRIPAGVTYRDDTNAADIIAPANLDVVLSGSGALGLDTGSEANNTWYYIWLCKGASGVTAVFSTSKTSPTLPTGYTTYKRRVRGCFRNDNSSNIIQFHYINHDFRSEVQYMVAFTNFVNTGPTRSSAGPTNILSAGSATSDTTIAATANYVPPVSRMAKFHYSLSQSFARVYEPGTSNYVGISNAGQSDANYTDGVTGWLRVDSSQQIGYALPVTSGNLSLDVDSFLDTEED